MRTWKRWMRPGVIAATVILTLTALSPRAPNAAMGASELVAANPMQICARCGETDPPIKHEFNDLGNWFTGGDFHSTQKTGVCSTSTESPAHTQTGCDTEPCTEDCLAAVEAATDSDDLDRLTNTLRTYGRSLRYNEERRAIQVVGCSQQVIAHFPVQFSAQVLAAANLTAF